MATIKDVAREAGVSVATVSNYLNRTTPVSKKRAKAIQDAIDRLKYSHNMLARNVRTRRNLDIGVILPDLDDSYYVQLFQGIKSYFQNTEYTVNVEFSRNIPEFERNIAESFLKKQVWKVDCKSNESQNSTECNIKKIKRKSGWKKRSTRFFVHYCDFFSCASSSNAFASLVSASLARWRSRSVLASSSLRP